LHCSCLQSNQSLQIRSCLSTSPHGCGKNTPGKLLNNAQPVASCTTHCSAYPSIHHINTSSIHSLSIPIMHRLLVTSFLVTSFLPPSLGQFNPLSLFARKQPQGCQYPSLSDGTYIYFTNRSSPLLYYSIYTPWTRFYPDALRADLGEQGFQLGAQHGKNDSDVCGWETVDVVKIHGWHRGEVSFRHLPGEVVKITKAYNKTSPDSMTVPLISTVSSAAPKKVGLEQQTGMAVHLANHSQRAAPFRRGYMKREVRPTNETLGRIHTVLATNSPEADILFMMLEATLSIIGVILFLTLMLLIMRHVTNKLYPNTEEDSEQDIELSSMHMSTSSNSDKTLVSPQTLPKPRSPKVGNRFPDSKAGGVFAWRLAMEKPKQPPRGQTSSIYSRSMDGVTLYPERTTASWEPR
jgi:hypothetical protein